MGDGRHPIVPPAVAVCVLRLEPHDGGVLITMTLTDDVLRDDDPYRMVTLDLERALAVVRETAARLRSPPSRG